MTVKLIRALLVAVVGCWGSTNAAAVPAERLGSIRLGFQQPSVVTVGDGGRLYLLDGVSRVVWVLQPGGELIERLAVMPADLPENRLPTGLAVTRSHIYVADPGGGRIWIRAIADGESTEWQPSYQGDALEPSALLVDADRLYFTDRRGHRVCNTSLQQRQRVECWGERGDAVGQFLFPYLMAMDEAGYLLVTDVLNGRVQTFHPNGRPGSMIGRFGTTAGSLYRPNGVAVLASGQVLVTDVYRGSVSVYAEGYYQGVLSDADGEPLRFDAPVGMAVADDRLYLVDALNDSLEVLRLLPAAQPAVRVLHRKPPLSRRECLICHLSWDDGEQAVDAVQADLLPVTQPNMCFSCHHGAVVESRHRLAAGEQHPSLPAQVEQVWAGDSGALAAPPPAHLPVQESGHLRCGSCHSPHRADDAAAEVPHANSWLRGSNRASELCTDCHRAESETGPTAPYRNHPRAVRLSSPPAVGVEGYTSNELLAAGLPESLVAQGARLGPENELICESCHRLHGAAGKRLLAATDSTRLCASCHRRQYADDEKAARAKGVHPVALALDEPLQVAGHQVTALGCDSCHDVHGEAGGDLLLRGGLTPESLCRECHPRQHTVDPEEARRKGVHPVGVELEHPVEVGAHTVRILGCLSCHTVHRGEPDSAALRIAAASGELCRTCHADAWADDRAEARGNGIHPVNLALDEAVEIKGKRVGSVTCLSCHSAHQGVEQSASLVEPDRIGQLCKHCHESEAVVQGSDHDLQQSLPDVANVLQQQHGESGLCGSCHSLHRAGKGARALFVGAELPAPTDEGLRRNLTCLACHSERGPAREKAIDVYEHPYRHLILRSDPRATPLLNRNEEVDDIGRIGCISCHDPHRWQAGEAVDAATYEEVHEGSAQNSFLRQWSPGSNFCTNCHGLEALYKYKYYHDSASRRTVDDFDGAYLQWQHRKTHEEFPNPSPPVSERTD